MRTDVEHHHGHLQGTRTVVRRVKVAHSNGGHMMTSVLTQLMYGYCARDVKGKRMEPVQECYLNIQFIYILASKKTRKEAGKHCKIALYPSQGKSISGSLKNSHGIFC